MLCSLLLGGAILVPLKNGFFGDFFSHCERSHEQQVALKTELSHTSHAQKEYPQIEQDKEKSFHAVRHPENDFCLRHVNSKKNALDWTSSHSKCNSSFIFGPLAPPPPWQPPQDMWGGSYGGILPVSSPGDAATLSFSTSSRFHFYFLFFLLLIFYFFIKWQ